MFRCFWPSVPFSHQDSVWLTYRDRRSRWCHLSTKPGTTPQCLVNTYRKVNITGTRSLVYVRGASSLRPSVELLYQDMAYQASVLRAGTYHYMTPITLSVHKIRKHHLLATMQVLLQRLHKFHFRQAPYYPNITSMKNLSMNSLDRVLVQNRVDLRLIERGLAGFEISKNISGA